MKPSKHGYGDDAPVLATVVVRRVIAASSRSVIGVMTQPELTENRNQVDEVRADIRMKSLNGEP